MKIAIVYNGLANTNISILNTHKKYILDLYPYADVYINTYTSMSENTVQLLKDNLNPLIIHQDSIEDIESTVGDELSDKMAGEHNKKPINTLCMYYKWHQSMTLLKNRYDIIIRNRLDISFMRPLHIVNNNKLNVPHGGDHWGGLMDLFAYANHDIMLTYHSLYNSIDGYISKMLLHPETLLRHHIMTHHIDISRFNFPIILRHEIFTDTAPTYD